VLCSVLGSGEAISGVVRWRYVLGARPARLSWSDRAFAIGRILVLICSFFKGREVDDR